MIKRGKKRKEGNRGGSSQTKNDNKKIKKKKKVMFWGKPFLNGSFGRFLLMERSAESKSDV